MKLKETRRIIIRKGSDKEEELWEEAGKLIGQR